MKVTEITPILCQGGIKTWTFVKMSTDKGITGWGDATEWVRAQGHVQAMVDLADLLIGEDPFDVEKLWTKMWVASYVGGKDCNVAITGIETALWDSVGKALGTPVYNLLGGKCHERVRFYTKRCGTAASGPIGETLHYRLMIHGR